MLYSAAAEPSLTESTTLEDDSVVEVVSLPPRGGLPLGITLGVTISALVSLLLGGMTALQLHRDEAGELAARRELLTESLAPVAGEIERATSLVEIQQYLSSSAGAEITRGRSDFNLILRGDDGRVMVSALSVADTSPPPGSLEARLLVAAHRRGMDASKSLSNSGIDPKLLDPLELNRPGESAEHEILRRYIRNRCALLEEHPPGDLRVREIALQMWERDAIEAEKFGDMELRTRAENAALKVLNPNAFDRVHREIEHLVDARTGWCAATEKTIHAALAADGIPLVAIQRRTKHTAGDGARCRTRTCLSRRFMTCSHSASSYQVRTTATLRSTPSTAFFKPEPFRFKDYIADPKTNGYQSLHTSVRDREGFVFEVQIRSVDMHRAAEEGTAAHWRYRARRSVRL